MIPLIEKARPKNFQVLPKMGAFTSEQPRINFTVKNTSCKSESYEVHTPDNDHFRVDDLRKFTLAPGMSRVCRVEHLNSGTSSCCSSGVGGGGSAKDNASERAFNRLRVVNSEASVILVDLNCPQELKEEANYIQYPKSVDLGEFGCEQQKQLTIPIRNVTNNHNIKLSVTVESQQKELFNLELEQTEFILLEGHSIQLRGTLQFKTGVAFSIKLLVSIQSEQSLNSFSADNSSSPNSKSSGGHLLRKIEIKGEALIRKQVIKNVSNGKLIESVNISLINGSSVTGQLCIQNGYRKNCRFKLTPEVNSSNPNEFALKCQETQLKFSEDCGVIKAFEKKLITYQIKTTPNDNDLSFIEKYSKVHYSDDFNLSKMKLGRHFKKNIEVSVKAVFFQAQEKTESKSHHHSRTGQQKCIEDSQNRQSSGEEAQPGKHASQSSTSQLRITTDSSGNGVVTTASSQQPTAKTYTFKFRLSVVNPALRVHWKKAQGKELFEILNDSEIEIPFSIDNHTLFKASPARGVFFSDKKQTLVIQWKPQRPKTGQSNSRSLLSLGTSGRTGGMSTFCLAYGKCDIVLNLPKCALTIFNFHERENIRPSTSTLKKNLGLDKVHEKTLKRPISAVCTEMVSKKLHQVTEKDFHSNIPKYLPLQRLEDTELEQIVTSSSEKGNIISNVSKKQIAIYFQPQGHLILKPLKAYLLPFDLNLTHYSVNDQEFGLSSPVLEKVLNPNLISMVGSDETYSVGQRELTFAFNPNKKQFEVENFLAITNKSKAKISAFLLTVDDQYFSSGEDENKVAINPNETVKYRIKLCPQTPIKSESKIVKELDFMIDGRKQTVVCYGELLPIECDYLPKELSFVDSFYGEDEVSQSVILSNIGFVKLSYKVLCPQYLNVSYLQNSGTIPGKGSTTIAVKFSPSVYLENYHSHIQIQIRGSHVIYVPIKIRTKKPDIIIMENTIQFCEGVIGDQLQSQITIKNRNKTVSSCAISFANTEIFLEDGDNYIEYELYPNEQKKLRLYHEVKEFGFNRVKFKHPIGSIPGFGTIKSPTSYTYTGKENILQLEPSDTFHEIALNELQETFKIQMKSLVSSENISLAMELIPQEQYDNSFLFSVEPKIIEIKPTEESVLSLTSLITNLDKLSKDDRRYILNIYRVGCKKPYTCVRFKVKVPTPKLILSTDNLYFPICEVNKWNHVAFKIMNKGYKEIHFKIKRPNNINFELECVSKVAGNSNISGEAHCDYKLTKLNNEAEIRVSFRSKNPHSFQTVLTVEDNFGNEYFLKIFGLATQSPLLLSENGNTSVPISAQSISSMVSVGGQSSASANSSFLGHHEPQVNEAVELEHAKFLNFWIGTFMHGLKKENSFQHYLARPEHLMEFLEHFNIDLKAVQGSPPQKSSLGLIVLELRKLDVGLDIVSVEKLSKSCMYEWNKFMFIFLSASFVQADCLKWVSKTTNQNIESYEAAFNDFKKVLVDLLNALFGRVFKVRTNEFEKLLQKFDPYFEFLYRIEHKAHLIICLNALYHKFHFPNSQSPNSSLNALSQTITTQQLTHLIRVSHNNSYEKTSHFLISNTSSPEVVYNDGGSSTHTNFTGNGYYFNLDRLHSESNIKISLKEKITVALLNTTLFQKCKFIFYDLQEIKPKVHDVVIECEDKFTQEWVLEYVAPIDSQYKIQFTGDSQFKCRYSLGAGLVKTGKNIPITLTYSPNNLNGHFGTLTIMNKHFTELYKIKGKALYSQNIEFQKQIRVYEGKKHTETIELPWEVLQNTGSSSVNHTQRKNTISTAMTKAKEREKQNSKGKAHVIPSKQRADQNSDQRHSPYQNLHHQISNPGEQTPTPNLQLQQYNLKAQQLLSHNLTITKQSKKQFLVKIKFEYLFENPLKKVELLYQITNEDKTQSKIIRLVFRVLPKPINIEGEIRCKLESSITEKIPLHNFTDEKDVALIQVIRQNTSGDGQASSERYYQRIRTRNSQESEVSCPTSRSYENQFKMNRTGRVYLEPQALEHISLTYRPDSLYESYYQIRITFEESMNVINYQFKGIPEFPSSLQEAIKIECKTQELKKFTIPLKSIVRETAKFEVETNLKQLSGKDCVTLVYGDAVVNYECSVYCFHHGSIEGEIIFRSSEMTLIYPVRLDVIENTSNVKDVQISTAKIRQNTVVELELCNKSLENDVQYDVLYEHPYVKCFSGEDCSGDAKKRSSKAVLGFNSRGQTDSSFVGKTKSGEMKQFVIPKNSKRTLEVHCQPFEAGHFQTPIRLFNENMKEIIYSLNVTVEPHQQILQGPTLELFQTHTFTLPIKNSTPHSCLIAKPQLPPELTINCDEYHFPYKLEGGKTLKLEAKFKQQVLRHFFREEVIIRTDAIGDYNFICQLDFLDQKVMEEIYIHYQVGNTAKSQNRILKLPFSANFVNAFNQKLTYEVSFIEGGDEDFSSLEKVEKNKLVKEFEIVSQKRQAISAYDRISVEGFVTLEVPMIQKSLMSIKSTEDLTSSMSLNIATVKDKKVFTFHYPVKIIRIYENPHEISIKANSYEIAKTPIKLAVVKEGITKWAISGMDQQTVKDSFNFTALQPHENYLETIFNKPTKYDGHITFYNNKNQAQKVPLKIIVGEPKCQNVTLSSNVGKKTIVQIQLKNGKGRFKVDLLNSKLKEFDVEPREGEFEMEKGGSVGLGNQQSVAKINFCYTPAEYSGVKKAKVTITSEQGCYYFNLFGKFKNNK